MKYHFTDEASQRERDRVVVTLRRCSVPWTNDKIASSRTVIDYVLPML